MTNQTMNRGNMKHDQIYLSDFLVKFISERSGIMSVFNSATVIGWWRGIKGPIGRIGKPINNREYAFFQTNGISLYIEKKLIDELPENSGRIKVLMGDYGVRWIRIVDASDTWIFNTKFWLGGLWNWIKFGLSWTHLKFRQNWPLPWTMI